MRFLQWKHRYDFIIDIAIGVFIGALIALLLAFFIEGRLALEALP